MSRPPGSLVQEPGGPNPRKEDAMQESTAGDDWDDLLGELDQAAGEADTSEWGESFTLAEGETWIGFWRGRDEWEGEYGKTPIYLLTDRDGNDVFHWGGRAQLDKRIAAANPQPGDRIAIRRLEDA